MGSLAINGGLKESEPAPPAGAAWWSSWESREPGPPSCSHEIWERLPAVNVTFVDLAAGRAAIGGKCRLLSVS